MQAGSSDTETSRYGGRGGRRPLTGSMFTTPCSCEPQVLAESYSDEGIQFAGKDYKPSCASPPDFVGWNQGERPVGHQAGLANSQGGPVKLITFDPNSHESVSICADRKRVCAGALVRITSTVGAGP